MEIKMSCKSCGNEWSVDIAEAKNITECPFCGQNLANGASAKNQNSNQFDDITPETYQEEDVVEEIQEEYVESSDVDENTFYFPDEEGLSSKTTVTIKSNKLIGAEYMNIDNGGILKYIGKKECRDFGVNDIIAFTFDSKNFKHKVPFYIGIKNGGNPYVLGFDVKDDDADLDMLYNFIVVLQANGIRSVDMRELARLCNIQ